MKRILFCAIALSLASSSMAESSQSIEVSYKASSPSFKKEGVVIENQYILLANQSASKFYSPKTELLDSLESTPEGKKAYQQMALAAYTNGKMKDMPRRDGSCYVIKNIDRNNLTHFDTAGMDKLSYEEPLAQMEWTVTDSTKTVLGYECILATTDYHGRRWEAWFAPEIPLQNGPWKLHGLPGLILEAATQGGEYLFIATGLQSSERKITPVYLADQYESTDRKSYLKTKRSFTDNPLAKINTQLAASNIKIRNAEGATITELKPTKADFLETDYR